MPLLKKIAIVAVFILIGPLMYVFGRENSLSAAFAQVGVGDSYDAVKQKMGPPQAEERAHRRLKGEIEYHYSVWPLSKQRVISFADGKVVEKAELQSP